MCMHVKILSKISANQIQKRIKEIPKGVENMSIQKCTVTKWDLLQICNSGSAFKNQLIYVIYHINKSYNHISRCRNSVSQNPNSIHDKNASVN